MHGSLTPKRENQLDARAEGIKLSGQLGRGIRWLNEVPLVKAIEFESWLSQVAPLFTVHLLETAKRNDGLLN